MVVTLCGDLNHDEPLSTMDVTLALQMAANNTDIDFAADANSDGAVTHVNYEFSRHPFSEVSSVWINMALAQVVCGQHPGTETWIKAETLTAECGSFAVGST